MTFEEYIDKHTSNEGEPLTKAQRDYQRMVKACQPNEKAYKALMKSLDRVDALMKASKPKRRVIIRKAKPKSIPAWQANMMMAKAMTMPEIYLQPSAGAIVDNQVEMMHRKRAADFHHERLEALVKNYGCAPQNVEAAVNLCKQALMSGAKLGDVYNSVRGVYARR
ncbi:hypothetical protein EAN04_24590 [Salmonella enterica]|nr:hypothetical protein [Salmonella enterica]